MSTTSKVVRIVESQEKPSLSKGQKLFNKLIKQIDAKRQDLAAWNEMIPLYQQKCISEFDPLIDTFNDLRADLVSLYDKVYAEKIFSKSDKAKLRNIICMISAELV